MIQWRVQHCLNFGYSNIPHRNSHARGLTTLGITPIFP